MTSREMETIKELKTVISDMSNYNRTFQESINLKIEKMENRVDRKHAPLELEKDILSTAQKAIGSAIGECLAKYDSPMTKLVKRVIEKHEARLLEIIDNSFKQVINTDEFEKSIVNAFSSKVSRSIISNNTGLFDKVSNELKQDSVFRAKLHLSVSNLVEELLLKSKTK